VDLTQQRLPRDSRYVVVADARDVLTRARADLASWNDEELRLDADAMVNVLLSEVDAGQTQLFFDSRGWGSHLRTAASERLADLLVTNGGIRQPG
jgi:hypothetical protein